MKIITFFIISLSLLSSEANAKFPWPMFYPAITGPGAKPDVCDQGHIFLCTDQESCINNNGYWYNNSCQQNVTCLDIAGDYTGNMSDNCPGYWVTGNIDVGINSNCSFHALSSYSILIYGNITNRQDNMFSSSDAQTDYNGCGPLSITCTNNGTSTSCNYKYANGKMGYVTNLIYLGQ